MSDKEIKPLIVEGAVDVSRALKFWEMRELIKFQLRNYLFTLNAMRHETQVNAICDLLEEIESI